MRDTVPPPPYESFRTEIVFQGDRFHVEKLTHRKGFDSDTRYEVVVFPTANVSTRKVSAFDLSQNDKEVTSDKKDDVGI